MAIDFQRITDELTERYGEGEITIRINSRLRSTAGRAYPYTREIEIAGWMLKAPESKQMETLLHEVAHVFAQYEIGHGRVWKQWARMLGTATERCYSSDLRQYNNREAVKVYYRCEKGTCEITGQRKPRRDYSRPEWHCLKHKARLIAVR